ncbi:unnamed protein product, partial [Didymodactylos carnosus]
MYAFPLIAKMTAAEYQLPDTWQNKTKDSDQMLYRLKRSSTEYVSCLKQFKLTEVTVSRIERIQNKRCFIQYRAHQIDFKKRLKTNSEKVLFHGCADTAAKSIVERGFDRGYAGTVS